MYKYISRSFYTYSNNIYNFTGRRVCVEEMGLENGKLSDAQISVSSVLNDQWFYGKHNARLNTQAIPSISAGAWVAESSPDQFIRVGYCLSYCLKNQIFKFIKNLIIYLFNYKNLIF